MWDRRNNPHRPELACWLCQKPSHIRRAIGEAYSRGWTPAVGKRWRHRVLSPGVTYARFAPEGPGPEVTDGKFTDVFLVRLHRAVNIPSVTFTLLTLMRGKKENISPAIPGVLYMAKPTVETMGFALAAAMTSNQATEYRLASRQTRPDYRRWRYPCRGDNGSPRCRRSQDLPVPDGDRCRQGEKSRPHRP
jgi:hypothetical protein